MKIKTVDWKKIFANRTCIQNIQITLKGQQESKEPNLKIHKNRNRHAIKDSIQMANKHKNGCSTSSISRQIQIKTAMKSHNILLRRSRIQRHAED